MTLPFTLLAMLVGVQAGPNDGASISAPTAATIQDVTAAMEPSETPADEARDALADGLPARVVADLARRALAAPADDPVWGVLAGAAAGSAETAGASAEAAGSRDLVRARVEAMASMAATAALEAWRTARTWTVATATWVAASTRQRPRAWVGGASLLAVCLIGLLFGQKGSPRAHRAASRRGRARRRAPRAGHLLGRGVPAREVARQTGLARDLVLMLRCGGSPSEASAVSKITLDPRLHRALPTEGRSSATGTIARAAVVPRSNGDQSSFELIA